MLSQPARRFVGTRRSRTQAEMSAIRWLAVLPFIGILIGTAFVNRVEPLVFGMPLALSWIVGWVVLGAIIMAIIYVLDPANARSEADGEEAQ
jgi:xanthosine utilization system XapX-like protein